MEQEQTDYQYDSGASKPVRKTSGKKIWILLAIIILLAVVLGAGYYAYSEFVAKKPTTSSNPVVATPTDKNAEILSAEDTLKGLADTLRATGIGYGGIVQPYKVKGFEFKTSIGVETRSVTVSRSPGESATALSAARDYLKTKKYQENIVERGIGNGSFIGHYETEKAICRAEHVKSAGSSLPQDIVSLSCLDISDFNKLAAAQKPFYDLLKAAKPQNIDLGDVVLAGNPKQQDSQVYGYKTADQSLMEETNSGISPVVNAMFYQTPDGYWQYFTTTDGILECDMYKTDNLKRAYKGKSCKDANDETQYVGISTDLQAKQ